ncbi:PA2169 family four-helix-bundle protein [Pedobacter sp. HMF7647]|uniref:PA2169 family four-helix-bundle protein n=1 Tax=Hufsiella arboris TaxID=2695275 RepID=A0A7K1Y4R8_9SPHI|nr:PA2169 family four-helix-bundle protein [Hufsiella arboris]MXV49577.1 PA2169 family four-helix-bundle protein [Hufsiella arboris]
MESTNQKLIDHLNHLVSICLDGQSGYDVSAKNAKAEDLKTIFFSLSHDKHQFAEALKHEVRKAGGSPDKSGGTLGLIHRTWIGIKTTLAPGEKDDKVILEACITGEKAALSAFDDVLQKALLPADTRNLVSVQKIRIKEDLEKIEELFKKY